MASIGPLQTAGMALVVWGTRIRWSVRTTEAATRYSVECTRRQGEGVALRGRGKRREGRGGDRKTPMVVGRKKWEGKSQLE